MLMKLLMGSPLLFVLLFCRASYCAALLAVPRSYWRFEAPSASMNWEDTQNATALAGRENGDPNNDAQPWFSNELAGVVGGFIGLSERDITSGGANESTPGWFRAEGGC